MSGHEVDERGSSFNALEARLQDQRVWLISPCYSDRSILRGNKPSAMFRRAEESGKTGVRNRTVANTANLWNHRDRPARPSRSRR